VDEAGAGDVSDTAGVRQVSDVVQAWPVESSVKLASGAIVTVRTDTVRMPDGSLADREVVEHPGAVGVVALDETDQVLLIRQYRHPVGRLLWEIPAGLRDVPGEPLRVTAERELLEEVGYQARDWHVLVDYYSSPGISTERLRIYLARGLSLVPERQRTYVPQHEEAHLVLAWLPLEEVAGLLLAGELHNGVTAVGILSAYSARRDGFAALRDADAPER
jgi:8-oxo-dGTP pyrophosphatase MutT (NUDIX family)